MVRVEDLDSCFITVDCNGELVLVVLLSREGSINRMGDLYYPPRGDPWHIGRVEEPLFDSLLEVVTDDMLLYAGRYEVPERLGMECECKIVFGTKEGGVTGFDILYGTESQGPPGELLTVIARAMELTDNWWKAQPGTVLRSL